MTSLFYNEYASIGEQAAYHNAVLADEARRAEISPMNSRARAEEDTATPPPVMIPSADMIREMAEDCFLQFTEELSATVVEEVEGPIDYERVADQPTDNDPGLPFFPN